MDLPSLNRGKIERPKNVTMNFVPTTGTNNLGMTIKTEEVMIDGETHTNVTGEIVKITTTWCCEHIEQLIFPKPAYTRQKAV